MPLSIGNRFPTLVLLAVLSLLTKALPAAQPELKLINLQLIQISGGQGNKAWTLRYGTRPPGWFAGNPGMEAFLVPGEGDRAWFAHGSWLRLIDTNKGIVLGRWQFPGAIRKIVTRGAAADLEVETAEAKVGGGQPAGVARVFHFDPSAPRIPFWLSYDPQLAASASAETTRGGWPALEHIPADEAAKLLPDFENMVRRDRFSPWLAIARAELLDCMHDPRAAIAFREAVDIPARFTELFRISVFLSENGRGEAASAAFERGYRDFLQQGLDPRFFTSSSGRAMLFPVRFRGGPNQADYLERVYALSPAGEGASEAWASYANWLEKGGRTQEAQQWRLRQQEARRSSLFILQELMLPLDIAVFAVLSCSIAGFVYCMVLFGRYYRSHAEALRQPGARRLSRFLLFPFSYWSRRERVAFLLLALAAWLVLGIAGRSLARAQDYAAFPFSAWMGSFASPRTVAELERRPSSEARDLLLAIAYQQSHDEARAAHLYERLGDSAVAWNNLGVILTNEGKQREAKDAFERALAIDPSLADARFNLGLATTNPVFQSRLESLGRAPSIAPPPRQAVLDLFSSSPSDYIAAGAAGPYSGSMGIFAFAGG